MTNRKDEILSIIYTEKRAYVADLAKRLYCSEPSIRRDLNALANEKRIRLIHGGAIPSFENAEADNMPFSVRFAIQSNAKDIIAKKAAALITNGNTVMIDASSSSFALSKYITQKDGLTIISYGIKLLTELCDSKLTIYGTGGKLIPSECAFLGSEAACALDKFNADIAFFSCRGLSFDGIISDPSAEQAEMRRHMFARAKKRILLCTSERLGTKYAHNICSLNNVDYVVCDKKPPDGFDVEQIDKFI